MRRDWILAEHILKLSQNIFDEMRLEFGLHNLELSSNIFEEMRL